MSAARLSFKDRLPLGSLKGFLHVGHEIYILALHFHQRQQGRKNNPCDDTEFLLPPRQKQTHSRKAIFA